MEAREENSGSRSKESASARGKRRRGGRRRPPGAPERARARKPGPRRVEAAPDPSRTVLVAEDDPAVRGLVCRFLEAEGYRVIEARDGAEAVRLAQEAGSIDALVADVLMPELDGKAVADQLVAERQTLRVLYISASLSPEALSDEPLPRGRAFLVKPFDRARLAAALRDLLD